MSANIAGLIGAQLFRSDDLPYYHRAWTIIVAFVSLGLALAIFNVVQYAISNRLGRGMAKHRLPAPDPESRMQSTKTETEQTLGRKYIF